MLDQLKLRSMFSNLFQPNSAPDPQQQQQQVSPDQQPNAGSATNDLDPAKIQQMFPMEHDASDRLKALLDNMPTHAQYEPSRFAKIMGGLASLSTVGPAAYEGGAALGFKNSNPMEGRKLQESITDDKYNKAMEDYTTRLKPLAELGAAEKSNNSNMRIARNNQMQESSREKTDETRRRGQDNQVEMNTARLAQKDRYLAFKQEEAKHKGWITKSDSSGHIYAANPATQEIDYFFDPSTGDKITTDKLPEAEKLRIENNNKLGQISAQGDQTRQNEVVKGEQDRITKPVVPGKNTTPTVQPPKEPTKPKDKYVTGQVYVLKNGKVGKYLGNGQFEDTGKVAK